MIKFVVAIAGFAGVLVVVWLYWLTYQPLAMYEVSEGVAMAEPMSKTTKAPTLPRAPSKKVFTQEEQNAVMKRVLDQYNYWDKEQRSIRLYAPPPESKASADWRKDFYEAVQKKEYYEKKLKKLK